jgi:hypothetical protein
MQPTVKQQEQIEYDLQKEDESIGEIPAHQAELLAKQREEEEGLRKLSAYLQEINPERYPTFEQLRTWKATYGRIYLSSIVEEDDFYIFRPIFRQEWQEFIGLYGNAPQVDRQIGLIEKCLLYPNPSVVSYNRPAGYLQSLETQIMFQSGFVDDNVLLASIKVIK